MRRVRTEAGCHLVHDFLVSFLQSIEYRRLEIDMSQLLSREPSHER